MLEIKRLSMTIYDTNIYIVPFSLTYVEVAPAPPLIQKSHWHHQPPHHHLAMFGVTARNLIIFGVTATILTFCAYVCHLFWPYRSWLAMLHMSARGPDSTMFFLILASFFSHNTLELRTWFYSLGEEGNHETLVAK
jgi:hypothetical protein